MELRSDTESLLSRLDLPEKSPATVEPGVRRGHTWHELSFPLEPEMRYELVTPSANVTLTAGPHRVAVDDRGGT